MAALVSEYRNNQILHVLVLKTELYELICTTIINQSLQHNSVVKIGVNVVHLLVTLAFRSLTLLCSQLTASKAANDQTCGWFSNVFLHYMGLEIMAF